MSATLEAPIGIEIFLVDWPNWAGFLIICATRFHFFGQNSPKHGWHASWCTKEAVRCSRTPVLILLS